MHQEFINWHNAKIIAGAAILLIIFLLWAPTTDKNRRL